MLIPEIRATVLLFYRRFARSKSKLTAKGRTPRSGEGRLLEVLYTTPRRNPQSSFKIEGAQRTYRISKWVSLEHQAPARLLPWRASSVLARRIFVADAMTAGGHETSHLLRCLSPVPFRVDVPVMAARVSGSNPHCTRMWRPFPPARLPSVSLTIPVMISRDPDMFPAWPCGAVFPDADRRPKFDYDLRVGRQYPEGKTKQGGKD